MENQHQKIKGYRDLSQGEIDLMNKIKAHAEATEALVTSVQEHLAEQSVKAEGDHAEQDRLERASPHRWLAVAVNELQSGSMKLVRAVAQPTTF